MVYGEDCLGEVVKETGLCGVGDFRIGYLYDRGVVRGNLPFRMRQLYGVSSLLSSAERLASGWAATLQRMEQIPGPRRRRNRYSPPHWEYVRSMARVQS